MTTYSKHFGKIQENYQPQDVLSHNHIELNAAQLSVQWRRCSLTSDFWARYTSYFVPTHALPGNLTRDAAESVFSYLLNELFENCAKFSSGPEQRVTYDCWVHPDRFTFRMSNYIMPETVESFSNLITELLENDPDELYFKKLEDNAVSSNQGSGLGYLTLIKDYGVEFGFGFMPLNEKSVRVDVQAELSRKEK